MPIIYARLYILDFIYIYIPCKHRNDIDACKFVCTPALCIRTYIFMIHYIHIRFRWFIHFNIGYIYMRFGEPAMLKRHFLVTSSNLTLKVTANGWVLCKCPELSLMNVLFVYLFPSFRIYVHGDVLWFSCEMIAKDPLQAIPGLKE